MDIESKIKEMSERSKIPIEKLKEKWEQYFKHYRPDFDSDDACNDYIMQIFLGKYVLRPPVKQYTFVPIGFSPIMTTKKGTKQSYLFILDSDKKIRPILMRGDVVYNLKKISLFKLYKDVDLGEMPNGGILTADDRSEFLVPYEIETTPQKFLESLVIPRITIKDAKNHLSHKGSDGYVDRSDWKCIRGVMKTPRYSQDNDDKQWGFLTLTDKSILNDEPTILPDGKIVQPGIDVSISPWLNQYPADSEVEVYGTLDIDSRSQKPAMRAYYITPIHIATLGVA